MSTPEYREGKLQEEIDRLARLCEAKDVEIRRLNNGWHDANFEALQAKQQLSEAQEQIAMQAETLKVVKPIIDDYEMHLDFNIGGITGKTGVGNKVSTALSATYETVAAWRAKEAEPLRRNSLIGQAALDEANNQIIELTRKLAEQQAELFRHANHGLCGILQTDGKEELTKLLAEAEQHGYDECAKKWATALEYEREVVEKALETAFECAARIIEGRLRDEPRDINHEIRKCAAAVRDKGWQIKFLADYEELRASKGEVK